MCLLLHCVPNNSQTYIKHYYAMYYICACGPYPLKQTVKIYNTMILQVRHIHVSLYMYKHPSLHLTASTHENRIHIANKYYNRLGLHSNQIFNMRSMPHTSFSKNLSSLQNKNELYIHAGLHFRQI